MLFLLTTAAVGVPSRYGNGGCGEVGRLILARKLPPQMSLTEIIHTWSGDFHRIGNALSKRHSGVIQCKGLHSHTYKHFVRPEKIATHLQIMNSSAASQENTRPPPQKQPDRGPPTWFKHNAIIYFQVQLICILLKPICVKYWEIIICNNRIKWFERKSR